MNIAIKKDFYNMTPVERKAILRLLNITYEDLSKKHKRSIATIGYAINNKRNKVLTRISSSVNRVLEQERNTIV